MIKRQPRHHLRNVLLTLALLVVAAVAFYVYYALSRPLAGLAPQQTSLHLQVTTGSSNLSWPDRGQSAVAVVGSDILETHGTQTSVPTASTAKIITALTVLQKKPLTAGQAGPLITLDDSDVALYNSYVAQDGSVVPVNVGEQITEYQMIEALMLPSANNMADSLAIWAYGSLANYTVAANQYVTQLGLHDTHIGSDASGFSPSTTSTAHDLAFIGEQAMQSPVLRQIVSQSTATDIPNVASVRNVNFLLGDYNIIGIKTGNTDQAGGVYVSASTTQVNGQLTTIVTALVGAPSLYDALADSVPLITSAQANFASAKLLSRGTIIAEYKQPWGGSLPATVQRDLSSEAWRGGTVTADVRLQPITTDTRSGQVVGTATSAKTSFSGSDHANIVLQKSPTTPSVWWRLLHPKN